MINTISEPNIIFLRLVFEIIDKKIDSNLYILKQYMYAVDIYYSTDFDIIHRDYKRLWQQE